MTILMVDVRPVGKVMILIHCSRLTGNGTARSGYEVEKDDSDIGKSGFGKTLI